MVAAELASPFDIVLQPEVIGYYGRAKAEPLWNAEESIEDVLGRWESENETGAVLVGTGLNKTLLVEVSGFEPPTSTLRTWRSAS